MIDRELLEVVEFLHFETNERGAVYSLGANPKKPDRSLKLKFDDVPSEKLLMGAKEKVYYASIRVNDRVGDELVPNEEGRAKLALLERSNAFLKGMIRYVPSPEESRRNAKKAKQSETLAREKELIESSIHGRPNFDVDIEVLREYADSIGAKMLDRNGKPLSKIALIQSICGTLGIQGEYGGSTGNQNAAKRPKSKKDEKEDN